jgi:hypothetical protein
MTKLPADAKVELKPCPFCGNPHIEYDIISIDCPNCFASGPARRAIGDDGVLTSDEQWNKRPLEQSDAEQGEDALGDGSDFGVTGEWWGTITPQVDKG